MLLNSEDVFPMRKQRFIKQQAQNTAGYYFPETDGGRILFRLHVLLFQRKFPTAAAGFIRNVRKTADALTGDAIVNGPGKLSIFYYPHCFAGMKIHALAFSCCLYATINHAIKQRVPFNTDLVVVNVGIKPE